MDAAAKNAPSSAARIRMGNRLDSNAAPTDPYPASPTPTTARAANSVAYERVNMQEMVARLHAVAIAKMLFTRLPRSAISAIGSAPIATVTETTDTSAPSCLSETPQAALMYGNSDTMTWRSM